MDVAERLAERILSAQGSDFPEAAVQRAKMAIMDAIGVTLAGANSEPVMRLKTAVLGTDVAGPSLLFGERNRIPSLDAALINGAALHALDFDDFNAAMGSHPSAPLVPALLALGETCGASGQAFVEAYLVGFETETRIARAVNFHHLEKGWHPSSTLGVFGAAGACCRLIGLDRKATANALAIAVSLASGVRANFGTMTKPLHIGHCARNGLMAALLAQNGFTANPRAFEHDHGFLNVFNGAGTFDIERMFEPWWMPPQILNPGVVIKQHPCCVSAHAPIDAALALMAERGLKADSVAAIEARCHPRRLAHTDRPRPRTTLDARFSIQYCLARAILDGHLRLEHFDGNAHRDYRVRNLMGRIRLVALGEDEQIALKSDFAAVVTFVTQAGERFERRIERPVGYSADDPLPPASELTKFEDCAGRILTPAAVRRLATVLESLESIAAVSEITTIVADGLARQN